MVYIRGPSSNYMVYRYVTYHTIYIRRLIFHKRATRYRSLLRKMTYKDKGSYESSPPCISYIVRYTYGGSL